MRFSIKIIYFVLSAICFCYALYFLITSLIGKFFKKKKDKLKYQKLHHFAIIIPARNEDKVIENLLDSLFKQNYPKANYEIFVACNHCTDLTREKASKKGANIIDCDDKINCKGAVLQFAFDTLKERKDIDAYLIFDADNVVDKNFLFQMNRSLCKGYHVAQGNHKGKNVYDNWISSSYTLFYLLQNVFFNQTRKNLNRSCSINGTGFMIAKSLIDTNQFRTQSLTEDLELVSLCALNNEKIDYVSEALTYDELANHFKPSWKQRKRWSMGCNSCLKIYGFKLFKNFVKTGNISSLDMIFVYLAPLIQILNFFRGFIFIFYAIFCTSSIGLTLIIHIIVSLLFYLLSTLLNLYLIKTEKLKVKKMFSGIFLFYFFIFTWNFINFAAFFSKKKIWEPIEHHRNISIDEVDAS